VNYIQRGGDLYRLSRILGHPNISTTQLYLRSMGICKSKKDMIRSAHWPGEELGSDGVVELKSVAPPFFVSVIHHGVWRHTVALNQRTADGDGSAALALNPQVMNRCSAGDIE
jgi:hypothetical protein